MNTFDSHYRSGAPIRVGDHVACGQWQGIVVFVLASGSFAPGFTPEAWSYLQRGFMVNYDEAGLVFSAEADGGHDPLAPRMKLASFRHDAPFAYDAAPTNPHRSNNPMPATDIQITVTDRAGRRTASSGSKWEPLMGYSRAVRSGNVIAVTGTVGINADGTYAPEVGAQARRSLAIIQAAIEALGGQIEHVIRTRMYVTDVTQWEAVARVHGEVFADVRPATSILEVPRLIDADALIEIEADAIVA